MSLVVIKWLKKGLLPLSLVACLGGTAYAVEKPNLVLTAGGVQQMAAQYEDFPLFYDEYKTLKATADARLEQAFDVPVPKDSGGGYTHEQHKRNYKAIYDAGLLFRLTGDKIYADYARDLLLEYAKLFPTLGQHPVAKSASPGRLFWQSLNEAVWLLYSIQGYDAIVDALSDAERDTIESQLFIPIATFLSEGQPEVFNKIHNHGTWATAAVGMTGYTLGNTELVEKALLGLDKTGTGGFLKQMELLFSPDGYYNEGPYYQRYALMPFILFATAIQNNEPARDIFAYRDSILLKAIYASVQLSYNKRFFPINDAIKDKGIDTTELLYGVAIAYGITGDSSLLSVARQQASVVLTGDGLALARDIAAGKATPFDYKSMQFSDGAAGDRGALAILRSSSADGHQALVMKNTAQGLGHGHFDKLSWIFYDNNYEVVKDYGAARFLNIEPKGGGRYLPENKTWAKQTIAHNTLVVDEQSHFNGKWREAEKVSPTTLAFELADNIEIVAAEMIGAYDDTGFKRTIAMLKDDSLEHPIIIDVLKASSEGKHQYDLPVHYAGQIVNINIPVAASTKQMNALGKKHGYQHLWLRGTASATSENPLAQITWLLDNRFYTLSALVSKPTDILFTELGANDPDFNLLRESAIIQRVDKASDHTFVSILEPHGEYNGVQEYTLDPYSQIKAIELVAEGDVDFIRIETKGGKTWGLGLAYKAAEKTRSKVKYDGRTYRWRGFYQLFEL